MTLGRAFLLWIVGFLVLTLLLVSVLLLRTVQQTLEDELRSHAEVMATLREISKTSQVVIATHSPLVVNGLQGHEVSVVTRPPDKGTQAVLLKDVPGFEDAAKVYQPGEFWVSYCDGDQETPLLTGSARE